MSNYLEKKFKRNRNYKEENMKGINLSLFLMGTWKPGFAGGGAIWPSPPKSHL